MALYSLPIVYATSKFIVRCFSLLLLRIRLIFDSLPPKPPFIIAANHISHFDPPLLTLAFKHHLDFMTTSELFDSKIIAAWLRMVGCFPVNREKTDSRAAREALKRLRDGRIVVIYPEGGIRTGYQSILNGACINNDLATLAYLADCPVIPSLIIGSDQLYAYKKIWRRPQILIRFGPPLYKPIEIPNKHESIALWTSRISRCLRELYEISQKQNLITPSMIPRTAQERWQE
ncbi:MAG: 1-acyl-sn-glycerol-3-phosphate acyltransferase [Methylacidiphilales bacterium]|nr:1-acyl-sn-glycerol-3-phosphate acyltransferase [Candidatus Methylacidiphilales bacterium]MDW8349931.1 lysophospholipid acyltransferase family protein [Verrucomicrobiae bacterium]